MEKGQGQYVNFHLTAQKVMNKQEKTAARLP